MPSEISGNPANVSMIDTHRHLRGGYALEWPDAPDILSDLFGGDCAKETQGIEYPEKLRSLRECHTVDSICRFWKS